MGVYVNHYLIRLVFPKKVPDSFLYSTLLSNNKLCKKILQFLLYVIAVCFLHVTLENLTIPQSFIQSSMFMKL